MKYRDREQRLIRVVRWLVGRRDGGQFCNSHQRLSTVRMRGGGTTLTNFLWCLIRKLEGWKIEVFPVREEKVFDVVVYRI